MIKLPRLLDYNGNEVRRINPVRVTITENITPLSTATMELISEEQIPARSYVELFTPTRSAGIFRARVPDDGFGSGTITSVQLEHAICEVGDYVVTTAIAESVVSFPTAFSLVFTQYRGDRWQLGSIETGDDVVCNISTGNVLSAMLSLLSQVPDCYMAFDFTTTPWTINILKRPTAVSAEGRLSRNIISARVQRDDSQLFTRAYLAGLPTESDDQIGHLDADTISEYGVIETVLPAGDYTESEAYLVANTYLQKHKRPRVSVQISGVDFSIITGESLDALEIAKLYRLAIQGETDPIVEHITQLVWQSTYDSLAVTIQLSEEAETAVKIIHEQSVSQTSASNLANTRDSSYQEKINKSSATGTLVINVEAYTNPTTYTVQTGGLDTVNYAVLVVPDNESDTTPAGLTAFAYGISAKTKNSFDVQVRVNKSTMSGLTTVPLRWFAIAK